MKLKTLLEKIARERGGDHIPEDLEAYLADFVPNTLLSSETLQIAFGVTHDEMEELYGEAYGFYEQEAYVKAADVFRWLVLLNPFISKYWMGLGACQQLLGLFEKALHSYAVAALLDSLSPYPHFYAFECYEALGDPNEAAKALMLAEARACADFKYQRLKEEIATRKVLICK